MERDPVQLCMVIPLKYAVSRMMEDLKCVTSRLLTEKFPYMVCKVYWDRVGVWARGLFASTVGINEATIRHMPRTKASRRRVKRSLNCKETSPGRAWYFISGQSINEEDISMLGKPDIIMLGLQTRDELEDLTE